MIVLRVQKEANLFTGQETCETLRYLTMAQINNKVDLFLVSVLDKGRFFRNHRIGEEGVCIDGRLYHPR